MADEAGAGGTRVIKITQDYAPEANVPGVLMPYETDWFDMAQNRAQFTIEKNGVPVITGTMAGAGIEASPGSQPANGDVIFASGLSTGDMLTVRYAMTRYAEIPGT